MVAVDPLADVRHVVEADVWRQMLDYFQEHRQRLQELLVGLGLSFGDMRALMVLDADHPRPMGALADYWACDASNATWMVDRLEQRGLVERRVLPADRRVKAVALTQEGLAMKTELLRRLHEPPPELLDLTGDELEGLRRALVKLQPKG